MSKSNLPDNWEWIPLEKFATSVGGYAFPEKWQGRESLQFPFIKVSDMNKTNGYYIESAKNTVDESILAKLRAHTYPVETIIFPKVGGAIATNKKRILAQDSIFDNNIMGIVINPESFIEVKWLFYFLLTIDLMDLAHSGPLPSIRQSTINQLEIPVPFPSNPDKSRQIQSLLLARIEQVLFELTEARRLHDKIVADTNRLMDAVLAEVYPTTEERLPKGWGFVLLSDICPINPTRPRNLTQSDETMTSFVPMAAVDEREGRIMDLQARPFGEVKRGYTYFEENDVLFAKITPCMENGKVAIARGLINGFGFGSTEFHVLRPTNRILPEWIYYFVRREAFHQEAKTKFRGAVGQQRVPQDFLETHLIPVPFPDNSEKSLAIQQQIVTRVQMTASEVAEAQLGNTKTGALLNQMEQSILAQAFRGEL